MDDLAIVQSIFGPRERGESDDPRLLFDRLHDDVVYDCALGTLHGKDSFIAYLNSVWDIVDADPVTEPLEYFTSARRAAIVGLERFTVRATGEAVARDFVWIFDIRDGLIVHIREVQDVSATADLFRQAFRRASS